MTSPHHRLVLVDNHPLYIDALAQRIDTTPDLQVVGTASDSETGLRTTLAHHPDLVLVNVEITGRGAFTLADDLRTRAPQARIVFWGNYFSDVLLDEALRLDVAGYLLTSEPVDQLLKAFRAVCQGESAFSDEIRSRLDYDAASGSYTAKFHGDLATLTHRQLSVLRHLARGESIKSVAKTMSLSERAVESHKYRIMRRLGIHDRVELARYAIREGLAVP